MINISNMDQIKEVIEGNEFFQILDKGDYYVAKYVLSGQYDTIFGEMSEEEYTKRMLLREIRGLIFDKSGKLIRRPFQKIFNFNQMEEPFNVSQNHIIMDKLDGSMIASFILDGELLHGTKAGISDVSVNATKYTERNTKYNEFAKYLIKQGYTPCFEYCSPLNQIVIHYPEEIMYFLAARDMHTGEYMTNSDTQSLCDKFEIPHVTIYDSVTNVDEFVQYVKTLKDKEGFIARFDNGFSLKFKADDYVAAHGVVSDAKGERKIFEYAFADSLDDIYGLLPVQYKDRLDKFIEHYNRVISGYVKDIVDFVKENKDNDRQAVYNEIKNDPLSKAYMRTFNLYITTGELDYDEIKKQIVIILERNLNKRDKIRNNRHLVDGLKWEVHYEND